MKHTLKQPCRACPFRRKAAPGWLGSGDPDSFVEAALADRFNDGIEGSDALPCHLTVNYETPEWTTQLADAEVCHGALVFYRNVDAFKLPRQWEREDLVRQVRPDHDVVFSTPEEFINHHESGDVRSWEIARRSS